jgi:hypothetical protein
LAPSRIGVGASGGVGLRRDVADLARGFYLGIADKVHCYGRVRRPFLEGALGDVEDRLALPGLRQANDHLSGADDLSRIRPDRGDDSVVIGFQLGVGEIFARLDLPGARRVKLGLRGFEGLERLIVRHLRGVAIFQKLALAVLLSLAPRHLGFRDGNLGFCDFEVLAVLLRVETGKEIVFLHLCPDIDGPFEDLAVDAKAEIGLVARLDLAGQRHVLPPFLQRDRCGAYRSDGLRRSLLFFVAGRQRRQQNENTSRPQREGQQAN